MTRIQSLASRPKRTLAALAVVLAAVGITVGSGANFTASAANPGNAFATGSLSISDVTGLKPLTTILNATNLYPGGPASNGTVDIGNTGGLTGVFSLTGSLSGTTAYPGDYPGLADALNVKIHDCGLFSGSVAPSCATGGTDVYSGPLSGVGTQGLGNYTGGDQHRYSFRVTMPDTGSAQDVYQNRTVHVDFAWNATAV